MPGRKRQRTLTRAGALAAIVVATAGFATGPAAASAAQKAPVAVAEWLTTGDQSSLLARQPPGHFGAPNAAGSQTIVVDDGTRYQALTGFGAALTGSSASLLARLPAATRNQTLVALFGPGGLTVVRIPFGASDFVAGAQYSYDDQPPGATDPSLSGFSIGRDEATLIPLLRSIRAINPAVRIVATPWSPPGWMKTSGSLIGGTLASVWEDAYAQYLVRTLKAYAADGVGIDALTVQNEPLFAPGDYPGMTLSESQEAELVARHIGPALRSARITASLLGFDGNWVDSNYASALLADRSAGPYLAGTAFHCYAGDVSAQSGVNSAAPRAAIWITECSGGSWSTGFARDLVWETRNLYVGGTRNWATAVLWWNLALDPSGGPHNGGCGQCRGVLTVDPTAATVSANAEYWSLAQAAVATRPGAVRVASTTFGNGGLETTAFRNPDGSHALLVVNSGTTPASLQISAGSSSTPAAIPAGAVATFSW